MKIGDLAKRCGVTPSTIRFYESLGLLKSIPRRSNGYREYPEGTESLLGIIVQAQKTGFSLAEIKDILPSPQSGWSHAKLLEALDEKIAEIGRMEKKLRESKRSLLKVRKSLVDKPPELSCEDNAQRMIENIKNWSR